MWLLTGLKWLWSFVSKSGAIDYFTDQYVRNKDSELERDRIKADVAKAQLDALVEQSRQQSNVVMKAMESKYFWIPWLIATVPLAFWFGWGVLDSAIMNGALLPDVAELPPQLKEYADGAWQNIFYTGGAVAVAKTAASALASRMR